MTHNISRVLVTGANRGLGLGFTKYYLQQGHQVFAACRKDYSELRNLQKEFDTLTVLEMDVSSLSSVEKAFATLGQKTDALDILINNAGRMGNLYSHLTDDFVEDDAVETLKANTLGPLWVSKASVPFLKKGSGKKIISITSGLGSIGDNRSGDYYIYRISKAGLNMLNRNLAVDLKPLEITCIALCPGWVKTDMGGAGASLTIEQSVQSMTKTIASVGLKDTGLYLQRTGEKYESY